MRSLDYNSCIQFNQADDEGVSFPSSTLLKINLPDKINSRFRVGIDFQFRTAERGSHQYFDGITYYLVEKIKVFISSLWIWK
jgi:hypothetical protein